MIAILYLITLVILGIYSYSQIDLNLTLLQSPLFINFQHHLIQLGYYNRSASTAVFFLLLGVMSFLYILLIKSPPQKILYLFIGILLVGVISYPAFSHDIFNYIFDARILIYHHQNPYTHTALMFPTDDWTRFMNWTHRTYPYGPTFLPLTLGFYLIEIGRASCRERV